MANKTSSARYDPITKKFITGRATKYSIEIADELIKHCSKGKTLNSFCKLKRINRQTLDNWIKEHPEMLDAHEFAKYGFAEYYEEALRKQIIGEIRGSPQGNIFALKAYCGYRDTEPVQNNIQINYDSLPEEQKLKVLNEALKQLEAKECAVETTATSSDI